jgi:hypothetical protein
LNIAEARAHFCQLPTLLLLPKTRATKVWLFSLLLIVYAHQPTILKFLCFPRGSSHNLANGPRNPHKQPEYESLCAKLATVKAEDVAILVSAGELRPLGKPRPNAVKFFSSIELITRIADHDWLDDATKTIGQFWKRKNARRHGLALEHA